MLEPTLEEKSSRAGENPWASNSGNRGWYVLPRKRGKKTKIFVMLFPLKITLNRNLKPEPPTTELRAEAKLASEKKRSASLEERNFVNSSDPSLTQHHTDDVSNEHERTKTSVKITDHFFMLPLTEPNITSSLTNLKMNGKTPVNNLSLIHI